VISAPYVRFCATSERPFPAESAKPSFRFGPLKPLKSLKALNQPFRGFLCYQGLEADFVSLHSREAPGEACLSASASRAASRRPSLSSILSASPTTL
jgi:hypothetical protein